MIYESDRNTPLHTTRESYKWANDLHCQQQAQLAIQMGDAEALQRALAGGADIHYPVRPLLVEAAQRKKDTLAAYLLKRGAQVNFANSRGETAVHFSAQTGNLNLLRVLQKRSAAIDPSDRFKRTPLMQAVFHGHFEAIVHLVKSGANLKAKDCDGLSVLGHARNGRAACDWKRRRSLRAERDRFPDAIYLPEEIRANLEQDFEWLKCLDEQYRKIRNYLTEQGAIDCQSPIPFLTLADVQKSKKVA